jgi:hypothetical protein
MCQQPNKDLELGRQTTGDLLVTTRLLSARTQQIIVIWTNATNIRIRKRSCSLYGAVLGPIASALVLTGGQDYDQAQDAIWDDEAV